MFSNRILPKALENLTDTQKGVLGAAALTTAVIGAGLSMAYGKQPDHALQDSAQSFGNTLAQLQAPAGFIRPWHK